MPCTDIYLTGNNQLTNQNDMPEVLIGGGAALVLRPPLIAMVQERSAEHCALCFSLALLSFPQRAVYGFIGSL